MGGVGGTKRKIENDIIIIFSIKNKIKDLLIYVYACG